MSTVRLHRDNLIRIREVRDLSQAALAKKLHVSQGYLSRLESGRKPGSYEMAERLATALDVPVHAVMDIPGFHWLDKFEWDNRDKVDELATQMKQAKDVLTIHTNIDSYLEPNALQYKAERKQLAAQGASDAVNAAMGRWVDDTCRRKYQDRVDGTANHRTVYFETHIENQYEENPAHLADTIDRIQRFSDKTQLSVVPSRDRKSSSDRQERPTDFVYREIAMCLPTRRWVSISVVDEVMVVWRPTWDVFEVTYAAGVVDDIKKQVESTLTKAGIEMPSQASTNAAIDSLKSYSRQCERKRKRRS